MCQLFLSSIEEFIRISISFEVNGKKNSDIIQVMNELKTPDSVNKLIADFEKNNPSNEIVNEPKKTRGR